MSRARPSRHSAFLLALILGAAAPTHAQAQPRVTEEAVQAAFLPKFARYVEWPGAAQPAQGAPYQLCVIGPRDPFGRLLDLASAGEQIESHGVSVRRMASPDGAAGCHIVFVGGAGAADTSRMLAALGRMPVLTVTDGRAPPQQQGMIHFIRDGNRVRFIIDQVAATERGLSISSRLLALAATVRQRR